MTRVFPVNALKGKNIPELHGRMCSNMLRPKF